MPTMPHKPRVVVDIRTGEETPRGQQPVKYNWGTPSTLINGEWVVHPAWAEQPKCTEFLVEFPSNEPRFMFQTHLACYRPEHKVKQDDYAKVSAFCFRAHRGNDQPGIAWRKPKRGGMVYVECNPDLCDLCQQNFHGGHDKMIMGVPGDKEKPSPYEALYGGKFTVDRNNNILTCKPHNFLLVRLLEPDGVTYAHHELELAMLSTHSQVTHDRMKQAIEKVFIATEGRMNGIRMKLIYDPFKSKHGSYPQSAWNLIAPDMTLEEMKAGAAKRSNIVAHEPTDEQSTALVVDNAETDLAIHQAHDFKVAATDHIHTERVEASLIDPRTVTLINQNATVKALSERLGTSYANQVFMPIQFGSNVLKVLEWLLDYAREERKFVADIMKESPFVDWYLEKYNVSKPIITDTTEPEPTCANLAQVETELREGEKTALLAEFTEIQNDNRTDDELEAATKGKVAPDDEQPTIFDGGK